MVSELTVGGNGWYMNGQCVVSECFVGGHLVSVNGQWVARWWSALF